jgi:hypothetical protein
LPNSLQKKREEVTHALPFEQTCGRFLFSSGIFKSKGKRQKRRKSPPRRFDITGKRVLTTGVLPEEQRSPIPLPAKLICIDEEKEKLKGRLKSLIETFKAEHLLLNGATRNCEFDRAQLLASKRVAKNLKMKSRARKNLSQDDRNYHSAKLSLAQTGFAKRFKKESSTDDEQDYQLNPDFCSNFSETLTDQLNIRFFNEKSKQKLFNEMDGLIDHNYFRKRTPENNQSRSSFAYSDNIRCERDEYSQMHENIALSVLVEGLEQNETSTCIGVAGGAEEHLQASNITAVIEDQNNLKNMLHLDRILSKFSEDLILSGLTVDDIRENDQSEIIIFLQEYLKFSHLTAKKCAQALKNLIGS